MSLTEQTLVQIGTDKPHLPIDRPLDNTALSAYMTCPREYQYSMLEHRRGAGKSPALTYGSAWHKLLEVHYKTNGNYVAAEHLARESWEGHDSPEDHRTVDRLMVDYAGYRKRWGDRPDKEQGRTVGYPDAPLVEISVNAQGPDLIHPYAGKIDRIIDLNGLLYVEDHKTTSRLDRYYFSQFENSNQMMGYVYLANLLMPGKKVVGVRINVLHLLKGASNYERHIVTFSPSQLEDWAKNTNAWMRRLAADTQYLNENPGEILLGHLGTNGCDRKYGLCQYHRVCTASPRVRKHILETEFEVNEWNPLEAED